MHPRKKKRLGFCPLDSCKKSAEEKHRKRDRVAVPARPPTGVLPVTPGEVRSEPSVRDCNDRQTCTAHARVVTRARISGKTGDGVKSGSRLIRSPRRRRTTMVRSVGLLSTFFSLPMTFPLALITPFWSNESKPNCKYSTGFDKPAGSKPASPGRVPSR